MEGLPFPLTLIICKALSDLKSLDALTRASPTYAETFTDHTAEIFEGLISSTVHEETAKLLRAHVLLQLSRENGNTYPNPQARLKALLNDAEEPLPNRTPSRPIINVVRRFTSSHVLATAIMNAKLDYLSTIEFEHLEDKYYKYPKEEAQVVDDPPGRQYRVGPLSPPSFLEEMRVMCAILRITLFSCLARESAPGHAEKGDIRSLHPNWEALTVAQKSTFDALRETLIVDHEYENKIWLSETQFCIPQYDRRQRQDEFDEILLSLYELPKNSPQALDSVPWRAPAKLVPTETYGYYSKNPTTRPKAWPDIRARSRFRAFQGASCSPIPKNADWTVLRSLGLGLWDRRRMVEQLELCNMPQGFGSQPPLNGRWYVIGVDPYCFSLDDQNFTWLRLYKAELDKRESSSRAESH